MVAVSFLAVSLLWIWNPRDIRHGFGSASSTGQIRSLAVLPLENVSGNPEQEYFADGMTDELITQLAGLNDVRVISRTSVMPFKATRKPLSESRQHAACGRGGRRVGLARWKPGAHYDTAGEGRRSDRQLWAQSYEGDVADAIGLQREIARSVSDEIKAKITPDNKDGSIRRSGLVPAEAYDAYLQGLYFPRNSLPTICRKRSSYFNQATQRDPTFALAYAGLAESYSWAAGLYVIPPQEALEKAQAAADKALADRSESRDGASCAGMGQVCA